MRDSLPKGTLRPLWHPADMNGEQGAPSNVAAGSSQRAQSHTSFASHPSSVAEHGLRHGVGTGRSWAAEPLLANAPALIINGKPLHTFPSLGLPDSSGRLGVVLLLLLSAFQGVAWGCTIALTGRLSLAFVAGDSGWQERGTAMQVDAPLIAAVWGLALMLCAPSSGILVDFRCSTVSVQLGAIIVWTLGASLLLVPILFSRGTLAVAWIGFTLCAAGAAILLPLLAVLVSDQVRDQLDRAQAIGLYYLCYCGGYLLASIVDAAGAPALAVCIILQSVLVLGGCGLLVLRNQLVLDMEPAVNPIAGLWGDLMPSGDGGEGREWSDDSLLSDTGEAPLEQRCLPDAWCGCRRLGSRLRRHPLISGLFFFSAPAQGSGGHIRRVIKVAALAATARACFTAVHWGEQGAQMRHDLCLQAAGDGAFDWPDGMQSSDNARPAPITQLASIKSSPVLQTRAAANRRLLVWPWRDGAVVLKGGGGSAREGRWRSLHNAQGQQARAREPVVRQGGAAGREGRVDVGAESPPLCLVLRCRVLQLMGGGLGLLIQLSMMLGGGHEGCFWARAPEQRLTIGLVMGELLAVSVRAPCRAYVYVHSHALTCVLGRFQYSATGNGTRRTAPDRPGQHAQRHNLSSVAAATVCANDDGRHLHYGREC